MIKALLIRGASTDHGTFGVFSIFELCFCCYVAELPWKDNKKGLSCIPEGVYTVEYRESSSRGPGYIVKDVKGRTFILFHSGNFAGDITKGFKTDSEGCLLPGSKVGNISGQKAVLNSRFAMDALLKAVGKESFQLTIVRDENLELVA